MPSRQPDQQIRWPMVRQEWRDVAFLHWAYPEAAVAQLLPPGFAIDTFDGMAWVGLSPFRVAACGLGPLRPLRTWRFPETNLRTYVVGPDGQDGIWFLDIEAQSVPVTLGARLSVGAPYNWSDMAVHRQGRSIRYQSQRRRAREAWHDIELRIGEALPDATRAGLVDWLTGRWRGWTVQGGVAISSPVVHEPWPLRHAALVSMEETLIVESGLRRLDVEPLVHYSPGVSARFGLPQPRICRDPNETRV